MLLGTRTLEHYEVHAVDGAIGRVHDVYFDDEQWTIRHVVVSTGHWLGRHRVLVPFAALQTIDQHDRALHVALTKARVAASPDVTTEAPVSRQHEAALSQYYGFPYYWHGPAVSAAENWEGAGDPHLRSAREIIGYLVRGVRDTLGRVSDLLVDDDGWAVRYLVVDAHDWWPGTHVLVARPWILAFRWSSAEIDVDLARDAVRDAPPYDPSRPPGREFEERLHAHHRRPPYWTPSRPA